MELVLETGWVGNGWQIDRLNSFQRDIEDAASGHIVPRADVIEDHDSYHFYFEMPGLMAGSLEVQVQDDRLIVSGERKRPERLHETTVHFAERTYGAVRRELKLPLNARHESIRAVYTDGVLELTVEKRAESKPVKIQIN
jgi:HSP20 family protein